MMQIKGSDLGPYLQEQVKRVFIHRFTGEHLPEWAKLPHADGSAYELQFANDADWLANTYFWITAKGELAKRPNSCYSTPTWPNRPKEPAK